MKSYKVIGKDYKGRAIHCYECETMEDAVKLKKDIEINVEEIAFGVPFETVEIVPIDTICRHYKANGEEITIDGILDKIRDLLIEDNQIANEMIKAIGIKTHTFEYVAGDEEEEERQLDEIFENPKYNHWNEDWKD